VFVFTVPVLRDEKCHPCSAERAKKVFGRFVQKKKKRCRENKETTVILCFPHTQDKIGPSFVFETVVARPEAARAFVSRQSRGHVFVGRKDAFPLPDPRWPPYNPLAGLLCQHHPWEAGTKPNLNVLL